MLFGLGRLGVQSQTVPGKSKNRKKVFVPNQEDQSWFKFGLNGADF